MATAFQNLFPRSFHRVRPYADNEEHTQGRKGRSSCAMRLPRVNHLLLCIPLRLGTLLLATAVLVVGWVLLLSCLYTYDRLVTIPLTYRDKEVKPQDFTSVKVVFGLVMSVGSVLIVSATLLLLGVVYEKPRLFLPFLGASWVALTLLSLACLAVPIFVGVASNDAPAMAAALFFTLFLVALFLGHCTLVVCSLYAKTRDDGRSDAMKLLDSISISIPPGDPEDGEAAAAATESDREFK